MLNDVIGKIFTSKGYYPQDIDTEQEGYDVTECEVVFVESYDDCTGLYKLNNLSLDDTGWVWFKVNEKDLMALLF